MAHSIYKYWTNVDGVDALKIANASGIGHSHAYYVDQTPNGPYFHRPNAQFLAKLYVLLLTDSVSDEDFHSYVAGVLGTTGILADPQDANDAAAVFDKTGLVITTLSEAEFGGVETNGIWR